MSIRPSLRFFSRLALVGAVVVSTGGFVQAQSSGGDFGTTNKDRSSSQSNQHSEFNSLPFRAASNQNVESNPISALKPPIRLTSQQQPAQKGTPGSQTFNRPASSDQTISNPLSTKTNSRVLASQTSFGNSANSYQPQQSSQEAQTNPSMPTHYDLDRCLVSFIDDIMLPAKESGVIASLNVKEGDYVPAGTIVGQIDDELYQRMLEQAKLRYEMATEAASDTIAINAADKKYKVATIEARKAVELAAKGSKSDSERMMAVYTKEIALLERDKAVKEMEKADGEKRFEAARYLEVQTHIKNHVLQSDFDAYVIKILKKPQEYVQQGEEVMRIARMDRLWVQGTVELASLNPDEVIDRPVTITVDRARGEKMTFQGKITNVGLETQGGIRYMVKAEVQNQPAGKQWMLLPMSTVKMRIHLNGATSDSFGSAKLDR